MLYKALNDWVENYPKSPKPRDGTFKGALAASILKTRLLSAIRETIGSNHSRYKIVGSAGKGDWTYTPWTAIVDIEALRLAIKNTLQTSL